MSENNEVLDKVVETYLNTKASEKCKNCFCNDLCIFVLLKKGKLQLVKIGKIEYKGLLIEKRK